MSAHIAASVLKQTEKLKEEDSIFDLAKFLCDANKTKSCVNTSFSFSFLAVYSKENV